MYHNVAMLTGAVAGPTLALTGLNVLYSILVAFVLISVGFAIGRILPKRHTS